MSLELAELLFKDVTTTISELEAKYPIRANKGEVTRFAPSPTGFLHTGSLFTTLVSHTLAKQTNGIFYIRLEDTDTKREISGSGQDLLKQLQVFDLLPDEGYSLGKEIGNYGPYMQSNRADIYKVVIKYLIEIDRAYPCFCTKEELEQIRQFQQLENVRPGYYAQYAKCRDLSLEQIKENIAKGLPYIIRFKSFGDFENHIPVKDLIRGDLLLSENDQDIVILKSDGLPTYHFAHLVDDHFMRTTTVSRGEEWLPSLSLHLQLFAAMGWTAPNYAHLPVIMKMENGIRRKLSKRKDNEAAVSYFLEVGYPIDGIIDYLLTIANSNFEEWRASNPKVNRREFNFSFNKMSLDGALFDLAKMENISKNYLAFLTKEEFTNLILPWSEKYDLVLNTLIRKDVNLFQAIINIEREKENPRKDYAKFEDVRSSLTFFYYDIFLVEFNLEVFADLKAQDSILSILKTFKDNPKLDLSDDLWFAYIKEVASNLGFASQVKEYKKNPENYKGHIGDVCETIRRAISGRKQTPNLYQTLVILKHEITKRLNYVIQKIEEKK
jgi:glutamyl-tRNA synthetase